jgi:ATP-grasp domain
MTATSAGQLAAGAAAGDPSARRLLTLLLRRYGIPIAETVTADGAESAVEAAWWLGFPVTLVAEGTLLMDESGITRCGLATPAQVRTAYRQLGACAGPAMTGVRIRRQPQQGAEVIIGVARDDSGRPQVSLTLGGPAAALVGARVTRPAPITSRDAHDMLKELHGEPAPQAAAAPAEPAGLDLAALAGILERVGKLAAGVPDVTELELNPVIVTGCGAAVAGVRGRFRRRRALDKRATLRSVS